MSLPKWAIWVIGIVIVLIVLVVCKVNITAGVNGFSVTQGLVH